MNRWQDWIERYVRQVTRHLSERQREDVADELRSLLTEQVEERMAASDATAEEVALATITEFGEPTGVARRYAPLRPPLVSPPLQQPLRVTLLAVLGVWLAFALLWVYGTHGSVTILPFHFEFGERVGPDDLIFSLLENLGIAVLGFIGLDRIFWERWNEPTDPWDPRALPQLTAGEPISRFEAGVGVVLTLYLLYGLHIAPEWFAITLDDVGRQPWRVLDPAYRSLLPWIDLAIVPTLLLNAWYLWRGERGSAVRWLQVMVDAVAAMALFAIAAGGPLTVVDGMVDRILVVAGIVAAGMAVWDAARAVRLGRSARLVPGTNGA